MFAAAPGQRPTHPHTPPFEGLAECRGGAAAPPTEVSVWEAAPTVTKSSTPTIDRRTRRGCARSRSTNFLRASVLRANTAGDRNRKARLRPPRANPRAELPSAPRDRDAPRVERNDGGRPKLRRRWRSIADQTGIERDATSSAPACLRHPCRTHKSTSTLPPMPAWARSPRERKLESASRAAGLVRSNWQCGPGAAAAEIDLHPASERLLSRSMPSAERAG